MYLAKRRHDWERTARLCQMWSSRRGSLEDFMPDELIDRTPEIVLDGDEAMRTLERVFGGSKG